MNNEAEIEQYEVDLRSGMFLLRKTDLFVADSTPLAPTRAYRLWDDKSRAFGIGGNHFYDIFPIGDHFPYTYMDMILGDGTAVRYERISRGTSYADFVVEHNGTPPTIFQKSTARWDGDHWDMTFQDGTLFRFPESSAARRGVDGALIGIRNPQGEEIKFVRSATHLLQSITSPHNHQIKFQYDDHDRTIKAEDDQGDDIDYLYDQNGRLSEVRENGSIIWQYGYDLNGMTTVQYGGTRQVVAMQYSHGRVSSLTLQGTKTYRFNYGVNQRNQVEETMVTDSSGQTSAFNFGALRVR